MYRIENPATHLCFKDEDFEFASHDERRPKIDPRFKGKLLRLRKDKASVAPVLESHEYFKNKVEPLFPEGMLMEQDLCEVSRDLLKKHNKELRRDEKQEYLRNDGRVGTYLAEDEPHGLLVTSMLWDGSHASCDFKPKWLAQSPSAPQGSERCRTCAMQAKHKKLRDSSAFCPLILTSNDKALFAKHLLRTLVKMRGSPIYLPEQVRYAIPFLNESGMLHYLKELQEKHDAEGPLNADLTDENFQLAMTLRDCTMYMKASFDTKICMFTYLTALCVYTDTE